MARPKKDYFTLTDSLKVIDHKIINFTFEKMKRSQDIAIFKADVLNRASCTQWGFLASSKSHDRHVKNGLINVLGFLKTESFQLSIFFFYKKIKRSQLIKLFIADVLNIATCAWCEDYWQQINLMTGTSKNGLIDVSGFLETQRFHHGNFFF